LNSAAWQTSATVIDEIGFSVLKYKENTPILAVCARCQLKFLTPSGMKDRETAGDYLWKKFITHRCAAADAQRKDGTRDTTLETSTLRKLVARAG
jgi:hypothetical protein